MYSINILTKIKTLISAKINFYNYSAKTFVNITKVYHVTFVVY